MAYWLGYGAALLKLVPLLLFAACPLMHLFMHRGHGHAHQAAEAKATDVKVMPER
jgi:hypothetical protein